MVAQGIDPSLFRRVMGRFATGVTVISTAVGERSYGMTANAFMAGSLEPPLCVVSVGLRAQMHARLLESGRFGVSFLTQEQQHLAGYFAGQHEAYAQPEFVYKGATPVIARAVATLTADLVARNDCGDHSLFVGHITHMEATDRRPLLFYAGHYARIDRAHLIEELEPPAFW